MKIKESNKIFIDVIRSKTKIIQQLFVLLFTIAVVGVTYSNPVLNSVASGNVSVTQSANNTIVNQSSQQAIIQWNSFNIGTSQKTQFIQPNASAIALNRINPAQGVSQIFGTLSSNGRIILVNGAGINFGPNARVDVASLIASTADISNANFLAGKLIFDIPSSDVGSITNSGYIHAADYGLVSLLGSNVTNNGYIQANLGSIVLGTGNKFTLGFNGDQLINFTVDAAASHGGIIVNNGALLSNGGQIFVTASAAQNVLDNVIDMNGVTQAKSVSQHNGIIILSGGSGSVSVDGKLIASGKKKGSVGGTIEVLGQSITLGSKASLDASGDAGGGTILIGGNEHGLGPEQDAKFTTLDAGSLLNASAISTGHGGKIIVWSDDSTQFSGNILAEGGALSGNGGFAEVSGHDLLSFAGDVNLSAPHGSTGTLLLDPENLLIQTNGPSTATLAGNTYTSNVNTSILTVTDLQNALSNASILLQTGSGGTQAGDITVANNVTWSNGNTLTLSAFHSINLNANITNSSGGSLTLQANNTGTGSGTITFGGGIVNMTGGGAVTLYYNPAVFATQDAAIANASNSANTSHFVLGNSTTFLPYMLVNNATNLQAMNTNLNGDYALGNNITYSGVGFVPIGSETNPFNGNFNGQSDSINNLISTQNGLFGAISSSAIVQNVGVQNATVTLTNKSSGNYGLLVGDNQGTLINVYSTGSIKNNDTGGSEVFGSLAGSNSGSISASHSSGNVTNNDSAAGTETFGGLVGANSGNIINDFSQSNVSNVSSNGGKEMFAGLVGSALANNANNSQILNSNSSGIITNSDKHGAEIFGGLVGEIIPIGLNVPNVTTSYSSSTIGNTDSGGSEIFGGLVGEIINGSVNISYNTGNITNHDTAGAEIFGGIVGYNNNGTVTNSYSISNVTNNENGGGSEIFGGFIGLNTGTVLNSYSQGTVSNTDKAGIEYFGGFAGSNVGTIVNAYATGSILNTEQIGSEYFAGLVGSNNGTIAGSYTTDSVTNNDSGGKEYFGGLVGFNNNTIINSYTVGNVSTSDSTGSESFGGLVGYQSAFGYVNNSYNAGLVSGSSPVQHAGGLAGYNDGYINQSYSAGSVTVQASYVGGLIGYNGVDAFVSNSYSMENVISSGSYVGGLIGYNDGYVTNTFSSGLVKTSGNYVGGLIGYNDIYGTVINSYTAGNVTGGQYVGGLVGFNNGDSIDQIFGTIMNSYSSGSVKGTSNTGGFVGGDTGMISGSFFDADTTGQANSGSSSTGVVAGCFSGTCTTPSVSANLSSYNTYANAGWDITDVSGVAGQQPANAWFIADGGTRPILMMEFATVITNAHQLQLAASNPGASYIVANNLDLSGTTNPADIWGGIKGGGFVAIGTSTNPFSGSFDGQGHIISNFYSAHNGVFGYESNTGIIQNMSIINSNVSVANVGNIGYGMLVGNNQGGILSNVYSSGDTLTASLGTNVGGLVGLNTGIITNVYSNDVVIGNSAVGGLIGENDGSVTNAYSIGSVSGTSNVGGLAGINTGSVISAYSTDTVTGSNVEAGGLLGSNSGSVSNDYSTGSVTGNTWVGGLIGENTGSVSNTYSSSTVKGIDVVGGLIGNNNADISSVTNSYSRNAVSGTTNVGGLIGSFQAGYLSTSFSAGSVSGTADIGGLIGIYQNISQPDPISNVYSLSSVNGGTNVGGLIGLATGTNAGLTNSYSAGFVVGTSNVGGLIGNSTIATVDSFYDQNTSGQNLGVGAGTSGQTGVIGKTTLQMITQTTFCTSGTCSGGTTGYDFTPTSGPWGIVNGASYPYFQVFYPSLPRVVSGIANVAGGSTVNLEVNGSQIATVNNLPGGVISSSTSSTGANGFYYFLESNNVIPDTNTSSSPSLIVASLASGAGAAFTQASSGGASTTGLNILSSNLSLGDGSAHVFSNAFLASVQSDPVLSHLYTAAGNNLTTSNGIGFVTSPTTTLDTNGNITTLGNSSNINLQGALVLLSNTVLSSSGNMTFGNGISGPGDNLTLNDTSVAGGHAFAISNNVVLSNLFINGSSNADTLSMAAATGPITWNISSPDKGSFSKASFNGTFSNINTIDGTNYGDTYNVSSTIGSLVGGTGIDKLNAVNSGGSDIWNITGNNAGSISGGISVGSFSSMDLLTGSSHSDTFNISSTGSLSGILTATTGTLNYSTISTPIAINLVTHTAPNLSAGFTGIINFVGGSGSNTISDTAGSNTWAITANNAGTVAGNSFSNFANLAGGNADSFNLSNAAGISGTVSATAGTLNESAYTTPVSVSLATNSATNVGSFSGISNFVGNNNAASMISSANTNNTWNITGASAGNINGTTTFSGFGNLMGGTGNDTFHFVTGGSEITINGGVGGPNTLDYSALSTPINIVLTGLGTYNGFAGTSSVSISSGFNDISVVTGSSSSANKLTGTNAATTWTITGVNTGNLLSTNTFSFTNFPSLVGGSGGNTISYATGGSLTGSFTNPGSGDLVYNAPLTFTANLTLTSTGTGNIIFNGGVNWAGAYTLNLVSANKIIFNSPVSGVNGTLDLTAANIPQSITTGSTGSINVKNFNLIQGQWYQVGSNLPAFNVSGNFQINSGVMPSTKAQFIRAAGGSGTAASPYQLFDIYGLQGVGSSTAMLANSYVLINNISGSITSNWNSGAGFVPLGNAASPFIGSVNGQNYSVTNVAENRTSDSNEYDSVGLFGVTSGASISNLSLSGSFTGETNVGALIGTAKNTKVTNVNILSNTSVTLFNDGDLDLMSAGVGGLIGANSNGTISNSSSAATVTDQMWDSEAGGLIGYNYNGSTVSGSVSTGAVINGILSSNNNGGYGGGSCGGGNGGYGGDDDNNNNAGSNNAIGGLVGYNAGTISNSHSSAAISSANGVGSTTIGGVAGTNTGAITGSYNTGNITAGSRTTNSSIGGIVGSGTKESSVSNSYNKGNIIVGKDSSKDNVSGTVGSNNGSVQSSTNYGIVTYTIDSNDDDDDSKPGDSR